MALLASTLPAGTKYATPQELLNLFAQNLSIPASDSTLFVLSNTAPTDVSKVWIDTSGASPVLKIYINGAWTSISVAANFPNGLTVTGADINLINNTVFVSNTNNRVGIGTASPTQKLDVAGAVRCQSLTLTSGGTLAADNITVGGSISATGSTGTVSASNLSTTNLTVNGTLNIPGTSISTGLIQDSSITTAKILDANVTEIKLSSPIRADLAKASALRPGMTLPTTGKVKGFAILNAGQNYSSAPTITIDPPSEAGGVQATAVATVSSGAITQITVTDEGTGYTDQNPGVQITGGGGSNAQVIAYACVQPLVVDDGSTTRAGDYAFLAISSDNTIKVSGVNRNDSFGLGTLAGVQTDPRDVVLWDQSYDDANVPQPKPVRIYSSGDSNYVLASDGTLWSAGFNNQGQLGKGFSGDADARCYFSRISFSQGGAVLKFATNLSAVGGATTCLALVQNSSGKILYGWGYNGYAQLGNGGTANVNTPAPLNVQSGADTYNTIVDIAVSGRASSSSCYVLFSSGLVKAAGYNGHANLSRGNNTANLTPYVFDYVKLNQSTNLSGVVEISGHDSTSGCMYFRTSSGDIYYAGYNAHGEAGDGTNTSSSTYVKTTLQPSGTTWSTGTAKAMFTNGGYSQGTYNSGGVCWAFAQNGDLYRWGWNISGQLGINGNNIQSSPTRLVGFTKNNIKKVVPFVTEYWNAHGGCAILMNDGTLYVSGYNGSGNLGLGGVGNAVSMTKVRFPKALIRDVTWINKNYYDFVLCVLATNGNVYTCGTDYGSYNYVLRAPGSITNILTQARL